MEKEEMIFREFCLFFGQDIFYLYPGPEENIIERAVDDFISTLDEAQKNILASVLKEKITYMDANELNNLWEKCGGQLIFYDDSISSFFQFVIEQTNHSL